MKMVALNKNLAKDKHETIGKKNGSSQRERNERDIVIKHDVVMLNVDK